jgi:hypothetical protein
MAAVLSSGSSPKPLIGWSVLDDCAGVGLMSGIEKPSCELPQFSIRLTAIPLALNLRIDIRFEPHVPAELGQFNAAIRLGRDVLGAHFVGLVPRRLSCSGRDSDCEATTSESCEERTDVSAV